MNKVQELKNLLIFDEKVDTKKRLYSFEKPSVEEMDAEIDRFWQEIEDKGGEVMGLPKTEHDKKRGVWACKIKYRNAGVEGSLSTLVTNAGK